MQCSPRPATRNCVEVMSVELAFELADYTLSECEKWGTRGCSAQYYELRDSCGKLVTSITLGTSADKAVGRL